MIRTFDDLFTEFKNPAKFPPLFSWGLKVLEGTIAAPGTFVVIGGRTGAGKSMLTLKVMATLDVPALYISLEDGPEVVAQRLKRYPVDRLPVSYFCIPSRPRLEFVVREIRDSYDALLCPKAVFVDYQQILCTDTDRNKTEEIAETISELKGLGRELGFVTIMGSQLKRPSMADGVPSRPTRWDMRDSSNIENAAESILLLDAKDDGTLDVWLEKSKVGPRGASQSFKRGVGGWLEETETLREQLDLDF